MKEQKKINWERLERDIEVVSAAIKEQAQKEVQQRNQEQAKETFAIRPNTWKGDTRVIISQIAHEINNGRGGQYKKVCKESYDLLNKKFNVDLEARLSEKRQIEIKKGKSKACVDSITCLNVISEDSNLIKQYIEVVEEMALKYGIKRSEDNVV